MYFDESDADKREGKEHRPRQAGARYDIGSRSECEYFGEAEYADTLSSDFYPAASEEFGHKCLTYSSGLSEPLALKRPIQMVCIGPNFRVGGVRQHSLSLAKFLDPNKLQITEFLVSDPAQCDATSNIAGSIPTNPFNAESMQRINDQCDVILMWGDAFNSILTCTRPLRVFVAHGETSWTRSVLEQSGQVIDHVIAVSERVRRKVCDGFASTTILNGVDTARLTQTQSREEVRRRFAFTPQDFVIGSVGRLTLEKQFHLLIHAIQRLPPHFKLLLVGSGRRHMELLEVANECIPGRFAIVAAHDYLGDYYQAMDVFGLVSAHEGFGLVLAEAMMCGRPTFSTRVGVAPEILVNKVNGVLVHSDPDNIAKTIRLFQQNRSWAQGLAMQGRTFAINHLNAARMARQYESLICNLSLQRQGKNVKALAALPTQASGDGLYASEGY